MCANASRSWAAQRPRQQCRLPADLCRCRPYQRGRAGVNLPRRYLCFVLSRPRGDFAHEAGQRNQYDVYPVTQAIAPPARLCLDKQDDLQFHSRSAEMAPQKTSGRPRCAKYDLARPFRLPCCRTKRGILESKFCLAAPTNWPYWRGPMSCSPPVSAIKPSYSPQGRQRGSRRSTGTKSLSASSLRNQVADGP